jgi:hypothetical protein
MIRKSTAVWRGDTLHGTGALTTQSEALHDCLGASHVRKETNMANQSTATRGHGTWVPDCATIHDPTMAADAARSA